MKNRIVPGVWYEMKARTLCPRGYRDLFYFDPPEGSEYGHYDFTPVYKARNASRFCRFIDAPKKKA